MFMTTTEASHGSVLSLVPKLNDPHTEDMYRSRDIVSDCRPDQGTMKGEWGRKEDCVDLKG